MRVYSTPGVYKEPVVPSAATGLTVSVPVFFGFTDFEVMTNDAQPLRQWSEFGPAFGGEAPGSYLAATVRGFFENGGQLCYVVALEGLPVNADDSLRNGLLALDGLDDADLVAIPDLVRLLQPLAATLPLAEVILPSTDDIVRLQQILIDACDSHGGRLALLDPPMDVDVTNLLAQYRSRLRGTNAALYYPWLVVPDPASDTNRTIPPCGHVCGVYSATDRRVGVFKAPANVELQGVLDLSRPITNADQDQLNPQGVNALRAFPGRGIRVWGARTISTDPLWRYVSVRRLFITAGRWIERNLASMVFEPHDTKLWARIARELTAYFNSLFAAGALKGASPAEAFFIKCDAETNPQSERDNGVVVAEIGLAPSIPNEFIIVRISVATSGVTIAALA